jgi:hypothetical protein
MIGTFKARAKEWGLGHSANGKEQVAVMFELAGGEHDGQSITWFGYFTEQTVDRTLDALRYCGWEGDNLAELDSLDANEVELVLDEEEYDGKVRTKVKWVNRPARLALKEQMTPAAAAAFAQRMRGKTTAHKQKMAQKSTPTNSGKPSHGRSSTPPGAEDFEDVPF